MIRNIISRIQSNKYCRKYNSILVLDRQDVSTVTCGNDYGGFNILPISNSEPVVYSFGIGEDLSFSEGVLKLYKAQIFAFDPTPKSINYVHHHELMSNERFHFEPIGLSDKDETVLFHLPENDEYVSGSIIPHDGVKDAGIEVRMECLETITCRNEHSHIDVLKMDIEGSEFDVIAGLGLLDVTIDQICLEIHDKFFDDGLSRVRNMVKQLHAMGYLLVYKSQNGQEVTFAKKLI